MACACAAHMASTTACGSSAVCVACVCVLPTRLVLAGGAACIRPVSILAPCIRSLRCFYLPTQHNIFLRYPFKSCFFDLCVWISRATTSGTRSASCSTTGSGIWKLINYHRKFVSVQSASTYGCHPHPTSLPSLTEQRGLLAMAAMACRPPGPHSPFGQRRELRIVSDNVKISCSEARLQQPE